MDRDAVHSTSGALTNTSIIQQTGETFPCGKRVGATTTRPGIGVPESLAPGC
jgi:hypothetical protein